MRVRLITVVCLLLLTVAPASARDIAEVSIGFDKGEFSTAKLGSPVVDPGALAWDLALQGVEFHVMSSGRSSINTLTIMPDGLEIDNAPIVREIDGTVRGLETADLNVDGSPELYVYVVSAGSGSYGSLVAYAANRRKSLSEIYLPPITDDRAASAGYMGHDEFTVGEGALLHRFPVYRPGDTNANATGGMRQVQYRLTRGEAGWVLTRQKP